MDCFSSQYTKKNELNLLQQKVATANIFESVVNSAENALILEISVRLYLLFTVSAISTSVPRRTVMICFMNGGTRSSSCIKNLI